MFNKANSTFKEFDIKIYLSSPTMHSESMLYMKEAFDTNWMSTVGTNVDELERIAAVKSGVKHAVALSCGTAALHLCVKLAGERLYGRPEIGHGTLEKKRVFCSDMTFDATLNPVVYEGGIPVFIDTEKDANKARKWSTQARENASWYQHEEVGYNYRMSNVIAGVVRGKGEIIMQTKKNPVFSVACGY